MIAIDLHVHTRRYSECAELLDPLDLVEGMQRCGLQGAVLTEHDVLWGRDELAALNRLAAPCRIYRGVEVSTREGHIVVIGIERDDALKAGMKIAELAEFVQAEKAVAIWAHPPEASICVPFSAESRKIAASIDAVEVLSTVTINERSAAAEAFAKYHRLASVAGSDAHYPEQIGAVGTVFRTLPDDEKALARMIKQGEGQPMRWEQRRRDRICHVA